MRLIDANALIAEYDRVHIGEPGKARQLMVNAPTIELRCEECETFNKTRLIIPQPERKRGKWINVNEGKWNVLEVLKCSACGEIDNRMYRTDSYCPNCGADMTGGDEDDTAD